MKQLGQKLLRTRLLGGVLGAVFAVAAGVGMFLSNPFKPLVNASYDVPFRYRELEVPGEVAMIYMDDYSHLQLGQEPNRPWSRGLHALLIDYLIKDGAKMIVFDVIFSGAGTNFLPDLELAEKWDQELVAAMKRHGRVVVAAEYGKVEMEGALGWRVLPIYKAVEQAAAAVGHSYTIQSSDYTIRLFPESVDYGGDPFPPLSLAAAQVMGYQESPHGQRYMNYLGPPMTLSAVSYATAIFPVLKSDPAAEGGCPPGFFKDKVVFIGARQSSGVTGEGKDEFRNPWPRYGQAGPGTGGVEEATRYFSPGTEVQAMAYLNLMRRNWMVALSDSLQLAILVGFGLATGLGLSRMRPLATVRTALLLVAAVGLAAFVLHSRFGIWFAWLILPLQVGVAGGWSVLFNSIRLYFEKMLAEAEARTEKAEKERALAEGKRLEAEQKLLEQERTLLRNTLVKQLSPGRVEQIIRNPELLRPGTRRQVISIMFSDIEAYSKLSENLNPDELAQQLNEYYELTLGCVHETEGTVVKLIGDAIFAIWNAPFPQPDHARRACLGALLLHRRLGARDRQAGGPVLRTRVGLNLGEASVGNIGSSQRFDYTAVGDSVNIASRLEGMNKMIGTGVLATTAVREAVGDQVVFRPVGLFRFKGVTQFQRVYEVVGQPGEAEASRSWREAFEEGWGQFAGQQWEAAEKTFRRVLALKPEDGPALYYLDRIAELRASPPGTDWRGEIILHEK